MADSLTVPKILQAPTRVGTGTLAANVKVLAVRLGVAAGTEIEVDAGAPTVYQVFSIPAGVTVLNVLARIITGFTATLIMDIGDGDDPNGWLATAKLAPTVADTAGIYKNPQLPTAEAYAGGKKYLAADTIDATIGTATPAVGLMEILLVYLDATQGTT